MAPDVSTLRMVALLALSMPGVNMWAADIPVTNVPPGSLSPAHTPQIILLTFDDAVTVPAYDIVQGILTNHVNPNGDPIKATFFVLTKDSDYYSIHRLHQAGHEIAIHNMSHTTSTNTGLVAWRAEIMGSRKVISDLAQIPIGEIRGFRAPFLEFNNDSFSILHEQGFDYDATIMDGPGSLSPDAAHFIWPYTLDHGTSQACWGGARPYDTFPGLFEVPMVELLDTNGMAEALMDPQTLPDDTYANVLALLKYNFTAHYNGNRAPLGLYLHPNWISMKLWRRDMLNEFLDWAMAYSNTWCVTTGDLTGYMLDPHDINNLTHFAPFQTVTGVVMEVGNISTCSYEDGDFQVCTSCPPIFPGTNSVYATLVPMTGGVVSVMASSTNGWFEAVLSVSNNTDRDAHTWSTSFEIRNGSLYLMWDGDYTTNGNMVTAHPTEYWQRPMHPGEVETIGFNGPITTGIEITISNLVVSLQTDIARSPRILSAQTLNGTNVITWDDSAYGYAIDTTTNLFLPFWREMGIWHGSCGWSGFLLTNASSVFLRLRPAP